MWNIRSSLIRVSLPYTSEISLLAASVPCREEGMGSDAVRARLEHG